jgi:hypothetical protein
LIGYSEQLFSPLRKKQGEASALLLSKKAKRICDITFPYGSRFNNSSSGDIFRYFPYTASNGCHFNLIANHT